MLGVTSSSNIGQAIVRTSSNGGHKPETLAELCTNRIVEVADFADPEIQAQARAFRDRVESVVLKYLREAVAADRRTVVVACEKAGQPALARHLQTL